MFGHVNPLHLSGPIRKGVLRLNVVATNKTELSVVLNQSPIIDIFSSHQAQNNLRQLLIMI